MVVDAYTGTKTTGIKKNTVSHIKNQRRRISSGEVKRGGEKTKATTQGSGHTKKRTWKMAKNVSQKPDLSEG